MKKQLFAILISLCMAFTVMAAPQKDAFFKTHGFVFFFASTCPHCHAFAPVLSSVAKALNAEVLPLSFDNEPLPPFKNVLPATTDWVTAAFQNEAIHYPALFIANPRTSALYSVSIGALSEVELTTRLNELIPKIIAYETKKDVS